MFNTIIGLICGASTHVESLGLTPVDLVVVETNGEIEGVDSSVAMSLEASPFIDDLTASVPTLGGLHAEASPKKSQFS
jgi:hypothetical protein